MDVAITGFVDKLLSFFARGAKGIQCGHFSSSVRLAA
jgi:hypothetical protein